MYGIERSVLPKDTPVYQSDLSTEAQLTGSILCCFRMQQDTQQNRSPNMQISAANEKTTIAANAKRNKHTRHEDVYELVPEGIGSCRQCVSVSQLLENLGPPRSPENQGFYRNALENLERSDRDLYKSKSPLGLVLASQSCAMRRK